MCSVKHTFLVLDVRDLGNELATFDCASAEVSLAFGA
jgi:hypothetical protein